MRKLVFAISALALATSASLADPIADRIALMKANGKAMMLGEFGFLSNSANYPGGLPWPPWPSTSREPRFRPARMPLTIATIS